MCHSSDNCVCLSPRKPADYPEIVDGGIVAVWGFTDDHLTESECVLGLQREVSGTQPPPLLINKFMYEEEG